MIEVQVIDIAIEQLEMARIFPERGLGSFLQIFGSGLPKDPALGCPKVRLAAQAKPWVNRIYQGFLDIWQLRFRLLFLSKTQRNHTEFPEL